jgi:hypothetical protein
MEQAPKADALGSFFRGKVLVTGRFPIPQTRPIFHEEAQNPPTFKTH